MRQISVNSYYYILDRKAKGTPIYDP